LLFHPTFLYELVWNLAMAGVLVWAERRFRLRHGRVMWLYVMLYTLGRVWIEYLRIDTAETVLGVRLNVWTSIVVFLLALYFFVRTGRRNRGRRRSSGCRGASRSRPGRRTRSVSRAPPRTARRRTGHRAAASPPTVSRPPSPGRRRHRRLSRAGAAFSAPIADPSSSSERRVVASRISCGSPSKCCSSQVVPRGVCTAMKTVPTGCPSCSSS